MICSFISYVTFCSSADIQLKRLQQRDNIDEEAARKRINAQYPMCDKRRRATHIVNNSGDLEETRAQVRHLIQQFNASKLHLVVRIFLLFILLTFFVSGYSLYRVVLLPLLVN